MKEAKKIINKKKNSSLLIKDASFQDSIIILSDNESESSNQKDQSNRAKKRKRTKTQEILIQDDQNSQCSHNSNKSLCQSETEIEKCPKRRKKNSVSSNPNATCLLLSDTEDSEIVSVDLDNENIGNGINLFKNYNEITLILHFYYNFNLFSTSFKFYESKFR